MVKCPFCQYENEEGALFCEQCKSDLAADPMRATLPYGSSPYREPVGQVAQGLGEVGGIGDIPSAEPVSALLASPDAPVAPPIETADESSLQMASDTMRSFPTSDSASALSAAPTPSSASAPTHTGPLAEGVTPKLVVIRGLKINVDYPIYEGLNFIGRADEKPVDIDLEDQEPPERIWSSRQHACISFEGGVLTIEDLNSSNGTFVNRTRVYPGQKRQLAINDVIQIGTVQMKVKA